MKKDLGSLIEQALENINNDRQEVEGLLSELKEYMSVSKERYADSGQIAAKFVETLQRSISSTINTKVIKSFILSK